jgi:hypothetical protein
MTPHHRDLVYAAALQSYWRRSALRTFLRGCRVSEAFLSTWSKEESKREFLDRLFAELGRITGGDRVLEKMSTALCEQTTFPDLAGWEDSKEKIEAAARAVRALRAVEKQRLETHTSAKERAAVHQQHRARVATAQRAQADLEALNQRLAALATRLGSQEAGYEFETWFYDLLDYFEIVSRRPYVTDGRQIDGSLTLDGGTTYLVELKFRSSPTEAPDIDVFFKKVHDKADNTMGVFISISGYTEGARKAASGPRTPLILLDHEHIYAALRGAMPMQDILARVRRHASQSNRPAMDLAGGVPGAVVMAESSQRETADA